MKVTKIKWLSKEANEAELCLDCVDYLLKVFCCPCFYQDGDDFVGSLHAFMSEDIMISFNSETSIKPLPLTQFGYSCTAKVENFDKNLVKIGDVYIELDSDIPRGISEEDLVDFNCHRFDIWNNGN